MTKEERSKLTALFFHRISQEGISPEK